MALSLPHSVFIHIPRTGGSWITNSLKQANIKYTMIGGGRHSELSKINSKLLKQKKTWSIVRHPLTYLQSQWCVRWEPVITKKNIIKILSLGAVPESIRNNKKYLNRLSKQPFEDFIEIYLKVCPGWVSQEYRHYLTYQDKYPGVDYIGKQENFPEDLINILKKTNDAKNLKIIRENPPKNASSKLKKHKQLCQYSNIQLKDQVLQAEKDAIEIFNYGLNT